MGVPSASLTTVLNGRYDQLVFGRLELIVHVGATLVKYIDTSVF